MRPALVDWLPWAERRLAELCVREALHVRCLGVVQGPMTVTFALMLMRPSRAELGRLLSLGPAIGQALGVPAARVADTARGVMVEVSSPEPHTPSALWLREHSRPGIPALGMNALREPVTLDLARWPHLLAVGPTRRGKSQAVRSMVYALLASTERMHQVVALLLARKREDWLAFDRRCTYGLVTEPQEQVQALGWAAGVELQERAAQGRKLPALVIVVDDLANVAARADLAGPLGELASMGGAVGMHLLLSTQTTGRAGGLTDAIEQNLTARLVFGAGDAAAGARYAGQGGLAVETVGVAPGDALLVLDGQAQRVATAYCDDEWVWRLPRREKVAPWNQVEPPEPQEPPGSGAEPPTPNAPTEAHEGGGAEPEPVVPEPARRLDATHPPTEAEAAWIRELYQQTGSKRQTVKAAYGFYNGKVFDYVSQVLGNAPEGSTDDRSEGA